MRKNSNGTKPKREKISTYKNVLSPLHQLVCRLKDTDEFGMWFCITCNKEWHFANGNGWHCIDRSYNGTLYDHRNCHLQCVACNGKTNKGEQYRHGVYINQRYWDGTFDELQSIAKNPPKLRPRDLCELIIQRTLELKTHLARIKKNCIPQRVRTQLKNYERRAQKCKINLDLLKENENL